jgi:hypothetical protein
MGPVIHDMAPVIREVDAVIRKMGPAIREMGPAMQDSWGPKPRNSSAPESENEQEDRKIGSLSVGDPGLGYGLSVSGGGCRFGARSKTKATHARRLAATTAATI